MSPVRRYSTTIAAVTLLLVACGRERDDDQAVMRRAALTDPSPAPACVRSWPEARYRPYGFDHVVHIDNRCSVAVECFVSTDVSPESIPASVPADTEAEVLTFVGSPASTFTPSVWCQLRARTIAVSARGARTARARSSRRQATS